MNIAQGLINRARISPDQPALSFADVTLDFHAVDARTSCLAGALRNNLGLARGDRVAVFMDNRAQVLELMFACWKAGLCVVPVNAKLHPREVAYIVRDSGARATFATAADIDGLRDALADFPTALQAVDAPDYLPLCGAQPITCADVDPTDPAWIFYTSGTTGMPKGAVLTHRNLWFMSLAYYADIEQVAPGHTMLHAAPLSHGSGLYALPHLFGGGHQVVLDGFDPDQILRMFKRYQGVSMFAAPTMLNRLVRATDGVVDAPGNLRTVIYGGGPMYVSDILKSLDIFGNRFFQLFGQGESPMTITGLLHRDHLGDRGPGHLARLGSCGVPRTGVQVRVVDESGRELPAGVPGEIVTRSDCVMSGYWNNPQATAAAIRDGWLWTGDIGSLDQHGNLTLRDRSKDLIISGGSNIYPREIEEVLLRHPDVLECSVVGRPQGDWGEEVVAFVVSRTGQPVSQAALDELCLAHIARFKRPRHYRFLAALPKNHYGKVLKTELRRLLDQEGAST